MKEAELEGTGDAETPSTGLLEHRAIVIKQAQLSQQLEERLVNQSSILCRLQQYESSVHSPDQQASESQEKVVATSQSPETLKAYCRQLTRFINTVSDRTRKANRLAHTIEHNQENSVLPLPTPLPGNEQSNETDDLRRQLRSNLESLQSNISNTTTESSDLETPLMDSYLCILTVIEKWIQLVECRILNSLHLTVEQSILEYKGLSNELEEVQQLCEQLKEITHALASQFDKNEMLQTKVLEGLEAISQHLEAVSSLTHLINRQTIEDNKHMKTLQNEMVELEQSVSLEVQILEEVCNAFAGEEELPAVQVALCKVEAIQEEVSNLRLRCLNQQLLRPTPKKSCEVQTVVPIVDLSSLEAKLRILHRQMSYRKQDPGFRQQRFLVRKYDTLLDSVCELSSAGRQCLEMSPLVVAQPENLKEQLSRIQNLFESLQIQSQRLQSTYSLLEELSASRLNRQHQNAISGVESLFQQFRTRQTELWRCLEDWTHLLPLLDDADTWLKDFTTRNAFKEPVSRFNIQNLVSQCKERQAELERHLPELYSLLALQSRISQTNIYCPSIERKLELCQQQWQQISAQVSSDVKELTSYLCQWQSCQSFLDSFKIWLDDAESRLEHLQALKVENVDHWDQNRLLDHTMEARKLQSEQHRHEQAYRNVKKSLDLCQRLGLHDPEEARELRQQLADQWEQLASGLTDLECSLIHVLKHQTSTLSREQEQFLILLPEKKELQMQTLISQDTYTISSARQKLSDYRDLQDELATISSILKSATCHYSSLVSPRNHTSQLLVKIQNAVNEDEMMLDLWDDIEKMQKQICEYLVETELPLTTTKEALASPISLEHAQREADRIESLHQEFTSKQKDIDNLTYQAERSTVNMLDEQLQSLKKLEVRWKEVECLISELRLALVDKLRDWDHYKDLLETVNRLLDEVEYTIQTSKKPLSFLEQAQINHTQLQHFLEELNESVPLLVNLENASSKLHRDGSSTNNLHIELQNQYTYTVKRWQAQESTLSSLSAQQLELHNSWSALEKNLNEINHWVLVTLAQLQVLDCGSPDEQDFSQLEALRSAVSQHGQAMNDTRNLALVLCQSGLLSREGCNHIKGATEYTHNSFSRLQHALANKLEEAVKADKEVEFCHHTAQRVQDCFQTVQDQVLSAEFPVDPETQAKEIDVLEAAMNELITCEMDLILLKDILGQHKHPDSVLAAQVVSLLAMWQDLRLKVCTRHSQLVTGSSSSSFAVRCQNLMAIFLRLKISLSKSVPSHYADIVKQVAHLRMLELQMNSHEIILDSVLKEGIEIIGSCLLTRPTEQEKQLIHCIEDLQREWSTMNDILSESLELLEHLIVLWRRCTKAKYSLQHWTKKARLAGGLPPSGEQLPDPETLESIAEEEDKLEVLLSTWPSSQKLVEELSVASEDLACAVDSKTSESVLLTKCSLLDELEDLKSHLEARKKHLRHFSDRRTSLDDDLNSVQKSLSAIMAVPDPYLMDTTTQQADDLGDCEDHLLSVSECLDSLSLLEPRLTHIENDLSPGDWHLLRDRHTTLVRMSEATEVRALVLQQTLLRNVEKMSILEQRIKDLVAFIRSTELQAVEYDDWMLTDKIRALEKVLSEIKKKSSALDDLLSNVKALQDEYIFTADQSSETVPDAPLLTHLNELIQSWQRTKDHLQEKLNDALHTRETLKSLKEDLENLSSFVKNREQHFAKSIWFFLPTTEEIDKKCEELKSKLDEITIQDSKLEQLSTLCCELESSPLMHNDMLECKLLKKKVILLQERHQKLMRLVTDKEMFYQKTLDEWDCFQILIQQLEAWLDEQERLRNQHRTLAHLHSLNDTKDELKIFEGLMQNLQANSQLTERLTSQFCQLSNTGRLDGSGQLASQFHSVLARWDNHCEKCKKGMRRLTHSVQVWDDFQVQREELMVWLTELDMKVTRILVSGSLSRKQKVEDLQSCQNEMQQENLEACAWEWRALHLHQRSHVEDAVRCENEVAELRTYWNEIESRIKECLVLMTPSNTSQEEGEGSQEEDLISETPLTAQTSFSNEGHPVSQSSVTTSSSAILSSDVTDIESLPSNTDEASSSEAGVSEFCLGLLEDAESNSQFRELAAALAEAESRLLALEELLQCPTPNAYDQDTSTMDFARLLAACHSTMDVVHHLSETTQAAEMRRYQSSVDTVTHQWDCVQNWALEKERRFRTAQAQWLDVQSGLTRMENWVSSAHEQITETWKDTPEDVHKLESLIQMHKEFLLEMEHINKVAVSVHHLSYKFTQPRQERHRSQSDQPLELVVDAPTVGSNPEVTSLSMRLQDASQRLEEICSAALAWQSSLQMALLQCSEFGDMVAELSAWLDDRESKAKILANVDVHNKDVTSIHFNKLLELLQDLGQCEPRVEVLQTTYTQLFDEPDDVEYSEENLSSRNLKNINLLEEAETKSVEFVDTEDRSREAVREARAQLASLIFRLRTLHQFCTENVHRLQAYLDESEIDLTKIPERASASFLLASTSIQNSFEVDGLLGEEAAARPKSILGRYYKYMMRVARASLPIQALMLLLLGVASLLPLAEEDFSCILTNNFARSFDPMLRYPNGPPPI